MSRKEALYAYSYRKVIAVTFLIRNYSLIRIHSPACADTRAGIFACFYLYKFEAAAVISYSSDSYGGVRERLIEQVANL